jgi:spore maturation protein CgeB
MPGKRVLLIGEARESGRLASYRRAFEKLGHATEIVDVDRFYRIGLLNRVINRLLSVPIFLGTERLNREVLQAAARFSPDLCLFIKPVLMRASTLAALHASGRAVCSWFTDDVFFPGNASRELYRALPLFDCHFTTKSHNVPELLERGARNAVLVPHAVDTHYHYPVLPSAEERRRLGADVLFVGTWADDRRVEYLARLCADGYQVKIFGNDWNKTPAGSPLREKGAIQFRAIYGRDFSRAVNASRIVLGFLRKHNRDTQTARTYEIPACGGFLLHERTVEATAIFREGVEAEYFDSYEELRAKIDRYLADPEGLELIRRSGHRRAVRPDLSYESRAELMLATLEEAKCAA